MEIFFLDKLQMLKYKNTHTHKYFNSFCMEIIIIIIIIINYDIIFTPTKKKLKI